MGNIDLAIIIPTLNEEHYIGKLLDSILSQTVLPKEIIVVDAKSKDKTIEKIKKRQKKFTQLRYFQIPKYTISRQRNFGTQKTKIEHILFLDADVVLNDRKTLEEYWKEVKRKNPDIATAENTPDSKSIRDVFLFWLAHRIMKNAKPIWPMCVSINFYAKRSFFEKVGRFDEDVKVAEDFEFLHRSLKVGGIYKVLDVKVPSSVRRFRYEGRIRWILKLFESWFYIQFYGFHKNPVKDKYDFGKHLKID